MLIRYQRALDRVSKVTMTMPINNEIWELQQCIDELEKQKSIEQMQETKISNLNKELNKCKKAIDKACTELNLRNKELCRLDNRIIRMNEKDWMEYLLKDE